LEIHYADDNAVHAFEACDDDVFLTIHPALERILPSFQDKQGRNKKLGWMPSPSCLVYKYAGVCASNNDITPSKNDCYLIK
jgi:hypothetical protein